MKRLEALQHPIFEKTKSICTQYNIQAYVIGGFVRDYLLKTQIGKDIDILVIGDGVAIAQKVAKALKNSSKVHVFQRFGTAHFSWQGMDIEFVGARKESYSFESRNPIVTKGTLMDDQKRRDFTINTIALSLNEDSYGELLDPFHGISDLQNKIIITPQNPITTFSDDPLRMLRAIRFAGELGFKIQKQTLYAIKTNSKRIEIISPERISNEINKIILQKKPSTGFKLLYQTGLLQWIIPELIELTGVEEINGKTHKDNFNHTLEVLDNIADETNNLWLRWAALLHDIGKGRTKKFDDKLGWTFHGHEYLGGKMASKVFKRLKLPLGDALRYVKKIIQLSSRPVSIVSEHTTDSAIRRLLFDAGDYIDDLITLCKADITTKNQERKKKYIQNFERLKERFDKIEYKDRLRNLQNPISGEIIMQTFGIPPSRVIGEIKLAIREAIIDGIISNDYEEAYRLMLKLGVEKKLNPSIKKGIPKQKGKKDKLNTTILKN